MSLFLGREGRAFVLNWAKSGPAAEAARSLSTSISFAPMSDPNAIGNELASKLSPAELRSLISKGYDRIAEPYLAWSAPRPTTRRMQFLNEMMAKLPSGAKILELGCGAGVPCTQILAEGGFDVTGIDISAAQIALGKQHVPKATMLQGDMMTIELPSESFDAVLAFYSFFHIPKQEQGSMIKRIVGWLKPGGKFLCNFGTDEGDLGREGWFEPDVVMFSSCLGVEGNRKLIKEEGKELKVLEDVLDVEKVGRFEETFHWILAEKSPTSSREFLEYPDILGDMIGSFQHQVDKSSSRE
jgi:SAM-dependent methyltransferase